MLLSANCCQLWRVKFYNTHTHTHEFMSEAVLSLPLQRLKVFLSTNIKKRNLMKIEIIMFTHDVDTSET